MTKHKRFYSKYARARAIDRLLDEGYSLEDANKIFNKIEREARKDFKKRLDEVSESLERLR